MPERARKVEIMSIYRSDGSMKNGQKGEPDAPMGLAKQIASPQRMRRGHKEKLSPREQREREHIIRSPFKED